MRYLIPYLNEESLEKKFSDLKFVEARVKEEIKKEGKKFASVEENTAERAKELTSRILEMMGFRVRIRAEEDEESLNIQIEGSDLSSLIGSKGKNLDALQTILAAIINRYAEPRKLVLVDAGGYRRRRNEYLSSLAKRTAKKVIEEGKAYAIGPLPARERRVIHVALKNYPGVFTQSEGEEPERRVIIYPERSAKSSS
jgi:spoIIIJ-associated protein